MPPNKRVIIKLVSYFLQYPDEDLLHCLAPLAAEVAALPQGRAREVLADFLGRLQGGNLMGLKEEYSRHFDLNPATCLNLTYLRHGDGKERGAALVQLLRVYREAGFAPNTRELPDYLPLVLEFLTVCPRAQYDWMVQEYQPQVEALAGRLNQAGAMYAPLLSIIADNLGD